MTSYLEILHGPQRIFILVKDLVTQIVEIMSCFVFVIYIFVLWLRATFYDDIKTTYKYIIASKEGWVIYLTHKIESDMKLLCDFKAKIDDAENAIPNTSQRLDDLYKHSLPKIQQHIQDVATGLALQTLDLDVHRRKWSLTVLGLKGQENEDEDKTRDICVKLAKECLDVKDSSPMDFAMCHRLSHQADSGVIIRFKDLKMRNMWLSGAKNLKTHADNISNLTRSAPHT